MSGSGQASSPLSAEVFPNLRKQLSRTESWGGPGLPLALEQKATTGETNSRQKPSL